MEIRTVNLRDYSSLRVGCEAKLVKVTTTAQLIEVLMYAKREGLRTHILGEGTNTFFGDSLENFLCIKNEIKGISLELQPTTYSLQIGAGETWDDIVQFSVEKGLWGVENLSYIPGTIGAAPVQNIGAYGVELQDVFASLEAIDTETFDQVTITREGCQFGYRDSMFKHCSSRYVIISVTIKLSVLPSPVLMYKPLDSLVGKEGITSQDVRKLVIETRTAKLPDYNVYPNTGSFFKNPFVNKQEAERLREGYPEIPLIEAGEGYKVPAAWLIEHIAEAKGKKVGDIGTWPNQPLVIVNYGEATASEILAFSDVIIKKIQEKTGIELEREVNYIV